MSQLTSTDRELARWMTEQYRNSPDTDRPDAFTYIRTVDSGDVGTLAHSDTHAFTTVHQEQVSALRDADYISQHVSLIFLDTDLMEEVFPRDALAT